MGTEDLLPRLDWCVPSVQDEPPPPLEGAEARAVSSSANTASEFTSTRPAREDDDSSPELAPVTGSIRRTPFFSPIPAVQERANAQRTSSDAAEDEYQRATGETLDHTLDIDSWDPAHRLAESYERFEKEVADAVRTEGHVRNEIRTQILPLLSKAPDAPKEAGHYSISVTKLREVQKNVLYNGLTEAADGTSVVFETLPVKMVQIGVGLVSYRGDSGTWGHRIFRRDVKMKEGKLVEGAKAILERRNKTDENGPSLSDLLRRAVMTYGERAVLSSKATAPWRMGHGNPLAYELLTGAGDARIIEISIPVLRALTLTHKKFVFVPSNTKDELLSTIGNALVPGEYAVVKDFNDYLQGVLSGHYRGDAFQEMHSQLEEFARDAGSTLVMGVFRSSAFAPAQVFYAHVDHVHEAAAIAMADSMLMDYRGFPMLLDLADRLCAGLFGAEALVRPAVAAFASANQGTQYLPERRTRVA